MTDVAGQRVDKGDTRVDRRNPRLLRVGLGALHLDASGPGSGFEAAFGSVGLLCVARLVATAAILRRGTEGGLARALRLTLAVWLLGRLASWWLIDLARGVSPLR